MDFPIIEEVLVIEEDVVLVVLMVVEGIRIITNHSVSFMVEYDMLWWNNTIELINLSNDCLNFMGIFKDNPHNSSRPNNHKY